MNDTNGTIRILIVDDHDMLRMALGFFLQTLEDLQLVGQARHGQEALDLCSELHPDVILMDLQMPEMDGIAATRAIRQNYPDISVIALTTFSEEGVTEAAWQAGITDYLTKDVPIDRLALAIRAAQQSKTKQDLDGIPAHNIGGSPDSSRDFGG